MRRRMLAISGLLAFLSFASAEEKPNIIFILADDLGYNQIGANGATRIQTPNIDRLSANGIRFTQAYSGNTVCSPSRVSLFTGRDGRLMDNNSNGAQLEEMDQTFAHVLKHAGYDTALFGKYSIGSRMGVTDPLAMGFDTWYGMYSIIEGHRQYPHILWRDGVKERVEANEGGRKGAYAQELFTNEAIGYIQQQRDNPFFVFLSYSSPHAELAAPEKYMKLYEGRFEEKPYIGMSRGREIEKYAAYYPEPVANPNATLAAMITALDDYVGQIHAILEERGIAENTLIIFSSDNGPHDEGGASPDFFRASDPYKGMKRDVYDGGIHVPMVMHWPARVKTPRVDETPFAFADFFPTFAELSGVSLNRIPRLKINGASIAGRIQDDPKELPERMLYWEFGKQAGDPNSGIVGEVFQAARRGEWKAVRYGLDQSVEVYNLREDSAENADLSKTHPEIQREFHALFEENVKSN
jgi:arylsulfatase A